MCTPGLRNWQQNSEIIHATSTDAEGPYKYMDTVLPHFSHGPTVLQYNDTTYMMMHLGCGRPFMPFTHGCHNGSSPGVTDAKNIPSNDGNIGLFPKTAKKLCL